MSKIQVYTDGSSIGNPGPGGWGFVMQVDESEIFELGGKSEKETTNNKMELKAIYEALNKSLDFENVSHVKIHSDSELCVKTFNEYIDKWKANSWRKSDKKPIKNLELIKSIISKREELENRGSKVEFEYVPAHVGIEKNERADKIATSFSGGTDIDLFRGSFEEYISYIDK